MSELIKYITQVEKSLKHRESAKHHKVFWNETGNYDGLKNLRDLARVLMNIPASSSYIERHFSLSGAILEQRRAKMSEEMICMRSMLKASLKIISNLNLNYSSQSDK